MSLVNSTSIRTMFNMSVTGKQIDKFDKLENIRSIRNLNNKELNESKKIFQAMSNYKGRNTEKLQRIATHKNSKTSTSNGYSAINIGAKIQLTNMLIKGKANETESSEGRALSGIAGTLATLGQNDPDVAQEIHDSLNEILTLVNDGDIPKALEMSRDLSAKHEL